MITEPALLTAMVELIKQSTSFTDNGMTLKINLIVAACSNNGIGNKGQLPWRLKKEIKQFALLTKRCKEGKQNAVVMGRKTWDSIPSKFRPLQGRLNLVITSAAKSNPERFRGSIPCSSFADAIDVANQRNDIDNIWVIGGTSIYETAMASNSLHRIYLTKIFKEFECDVFFPDLDTSEFEEVTDEQVPSEIQEEDGISYAYKVYQKV